MDSCPPSSNVAVEEGAVPMDFSGATFMIDISEVSFIDPVCIYPASFALQLLAASMTS